MHAQSIMDYVQSLFSFFIAPLFGTVILGMLWKRATPAGGWTGLLAGTLSSVGMYAWVKVDPDRGEICRPVAAGAGSGAKHVSRPMVLADLRDRDGRRQSSDQAQTRFGTERSGLRPDADSARGKGSCFTAPSSGVLSWRWCSSFCKSFSGRGKR